MKKIKVGVVGCGVVAAAYYLPYLMKMDNVARIAVADHQIVAEEKFDEFLAQAADPEKANYWDVVLDLPRTKPVRMEAYESAA